MKKIWNWILNNPNRAMFLIPILLVAGISISHVVTWYDMANPINWAVYLSIAIEVGAMTALVAATNKIKGGVWFMFGLVTFIQMIGNIFYSYYQIDETGDLFQSWIELTAPVWELMGTETTDIVGMKRWLAFLEGGLLPLISLTSLHFFVTYEKNDESNGVKNTQVDPNEGITSEMKEVIVAEEKRQNEELKKKVSEVEGTPTEETKEKSQKAKNIVESFGVDYEFDDEDSNENPLKNDIDDEFLEGVDSMDNIDEPQEKEDDTDEWDEDHALDMVMNEMVEDLMEEESVDTIEELIEVLEDESIVEDIEEEKEDDSPTTKQDVTINNKAPKRKMGIDRIR
tara:strand:- start:1969 stop:2991 length:1023 start_codon:yes stop_codon:yes gene_type:complete